MTVDGFTIDITNPPSADEVLDRYNALVKACFPGLDDSALLPAAPLGMLVQQLTLAELARINDVLYEINKRQGNAQGLDLDVQLINNFGLYRKPAINGTAAITIYGEPFYTVPAGFEIVGVNTPPFRLLYEATLDAEGQVTVDMQETEFTIKSYPPNTLQYIVTTDYNIHRVSQPNVTTPGVLAESDLDYLTRAYTWGALSNNSSFQAIVSRVSGVAGVTKCNGYENARSEKYTHQGTLFDPHSVGVVVYGGLADNIAKAIHYSKPPGVVLMGTETVKVKVSQKEIEYKFYRPTPVPLQVYVKVHLLPLYPNNYVDIIKETLQHYVASLQINARILYSGITCALHTLQVEKGYNYQYVEIKFGKKDNVTGYNNLDLQFTEMATLAAADIVVEKDT